MGHRRGIIPLVAAGALLIGACGGDDGGTAADDPPDDAGSTTSDAQGASSSVEAADSGGTTPADGEGCTEDRVGGSVTMGTFSEARGLDPIVMFGSGVAGGIETAAIFDRLMVWDPESGEFEPHVAESLESNEDFTVWTLTLQEGINFGVGDPLTADAVVHSIERVQSEQNETQSREAAAIVESMEAVDELTVEFTLSEGWANFPALLADEAGMITNPAVVESMSPKEFNQAPVGAGVGPYEPVTFAPGEEIVLEAKDDYWGGPVCIEELRFIWIAGGQGTWDAYQNDEMQMAFLREPRIVEEARNEGVDMFESIQNYGEGLYLNTDDSRPTSDVRIRKAIAHAVDPAAIDERVHEGTGSPTSAIFGEESLLYTGAEGIPHDPEEATRLLDEAKAEGYDGTLEFVCSTSGNEAGLALEAQLEAVGFDVNLNCNMELTDQIQITRVERAFDVSYGGLNINDASPWLRLVTKVGPGNNAEAGYESDEMNAALAELRLADGVEEQQAVLTDIQELWNADVPYVSLSAITEAIIWHDSVRGLDFTSKSVVLFHDAYLE